MQFERVVLRDFSSRERKSEGKKRKTLWEEKKISGRVSPSYTT